MKLVLKVSHRINFTHAILKIVLYHLSCLKPLISGRKPTSGQRSCYTAGSAWEGKPTWYTEHTVLLVAYIYTGSEPYYAEYIFMLSTWSDPSELTILLEFVIFSFNLWALLFHRKRGVTIYAFLNSVSSIPVNINPGCALK